MRILHLNPFYFPYAGGIERRIREMGRRHAAAGHEVHVLTSQLEGTRREDTDEGIQVHRAPSSFRLRRFYNPPLVATRGLASMVRDLRPDVIDFHSRWSPSWARAYKTAAAPRVFTYHNTFGEGAGALGLVSRLNDRATRGFIARSDRIVCISRFLADNITQHGFPPEKIRVVANGIDADSTRRQAAKTGGDPNLLVAVGRLVHLKGFDTAIEALAKLPKQVRLLVCGDGPGRAELERVARRAGVEERVDLPGWVPEAEKLAKIRDALAFVHPARFEAFGLAPLEALAMGASVIATRVGGLPEVIGDAGLLVPPDDPDALADAIERLRADGDLRNRLKAAAPAQAAKFSWDAAAKELMEVYVEAARRPKP